MKRGVPAMQRGGFCSVKGCGEKHYCRTFCRVHWSRWYRHGDPLIVKKFSNPIEGFWAKVNEHGPIPDFAPELGPCWIWTASLDRKGYGKFWIGGKIRGAHRVAYELVVGEIPNGLHLDHLCRVVNCVRPYHLEPVPQKENERRGMTGILKTHCIHGHEYTPENTYIQPKSGSRACRVCMKASAERKKIK